MFQKCRYFKLDTRSTIRVIKLEHKVNDPITCTISHIDYRERPDFKCSALSYVWGDSTPTRYIDLIDPKDRQISLPPIHENLWRFPDWALTESMGVHHCWIWTDRICLDQYDEQEMAREIPRMREVFRNAYKVLAWLGMSKQQGLHLQPLIDSSRRGLDLQEHCPAKETWLALAAVAEKDYWTRIWVLQEVALAKNLVIIIGNVAARLEELAGIKNKNGLLHDPWTQMRRVSSLRKFKRGLPQLWEMYPVLSPDYPEGRDFKSERPHDRLYGLLGMLADHMEGTSPVDHIDVRLQHTTGQSHP